jgi:hypothetical protein
MHKFAVVVAFFACLVLCACENPKVKSRKECQANKDDCKAAKDSFKCAMMFVNLTKIGTPKIIDIIPDIIDQINKTQNSSEHILAELETRNINYDAFEIPDACPTDDAIKIQKLKNNKLTADEVIKATKTLYGKAKRRANARCYAFLNDFAKEELDSCDTKLVETVGDAQTIGDGLCTKAYDLYDFQTPPKFWFIALVEIGAYVSYCDQKWTKVQNARKHLVIESKLCCVRKKGVVKFRPCGGSKDFTKSCPSKK